MQPDPSAPKTINSFVRRKGRLTTAQQRALETLWPKYGIDDGNALLEPSRVFQRHAPLVIDIGVGNGDSTLYNAMEHPENNYLAIEVYRPGIGHLLNEIEKQRSTNICIINEDVMTVLEVYLPQQAISNCFLFFPDPWPKKRHHKRRLINPPLVALMQQKLAKHGRWHIATDSESYAEHIELLFNEITDFKNLASPALHAPRPDWRCLTRYEQRGINLSHRVYDYCFALR